MTGTTTSGDVFTRYRQDDIISNGTGVGVTVAGFNFPNWFELYLMARNFFGPVTEEAGD